MRYNITRLANEIMGYEADIINLKYQLTYKNDLYDRQEITRLLNQKRHAKSLCYKYIGEEAVERMKENKSLDDTHEIEDFAGIQFLPVSAIGQDKARGLVANAVKMCERVGYRVAYEIHSSLRKS